MLYKLSNMLLLVGLGNPGYSKTNHNLGADIVRNIIKILPAKSLEKFPRCYKLQNRQVICCFAPALMNISGTKIKEIYNYYKCDKLVVFVDDFYLEKNVLQGTYSQKSRGHNGIRSIKQSLGPLRFYKILLGIGYDNAINRRDFVLDYSIGIHYNQLTLKSIKILQKEGFLT